MELLYVLAHLLLYNTAAAQSSSLVPSSSASPTILCYTKQGTKSRSTVPTTTQTWTSTQVIRVTTTSYPMSTITPPLTITTTTTTDYSTTTTTLPADTDTITSTEVDLSTSSITASTTITVQTTETGSTSTTTSYVTATIAAPAGFTPVQDTLPSATYVGPSASAAPPTHKKREPEVGERSPHRGSLERRRWLRPLARRAVLPAKAKAPTYPVAVTCARIVHTTTTKIITRTARRTTTVTLPTPTSTDTTTTTSTIVETSVPPDTTTLITTTTTIYQTNKVTPVTTTTTTLTPNPVTVVVPTSTYYAQCSNSNLADRVNGSYVGYFHSGSFNNINNAYHVASDTAYDCCVACAMDPHCAVSAKGVSHGRPVCFILTTGVNQCSPDTADIGIDYGNGADSGLQLTISNGNCGQYGSEFPPS